MIKINTTWNCALKTSWNFLLKLGETRKFAKTSNTRNVFGKRLINLFINPDQIHLLFLGKQ